MRSRTLLLAVLAFLAGSGVGAFFGPDNANARHPALGTARIATIPEGFRWSGDGQCVWQGAQVTMVVATVASNEGPYRVYLALSKNDGAAESAPIGGVVGVGDPGSTGSYETRLTDVTAAKGRASGTARSGMFPFADEIGIPLGPFAGSLIVFNWSCDEP
jgi:hypothetical protein